MNRLEHCWPDADRNAVISRPLVVGRDVASAEAHKYGLHYQVPVNESERLSMRCAGGETWEIVGTPGVVPDVVDEEG